MSSMMESRTEVKISAMTTLGLGRSEEERVDDGI